MSLPIIDIHAGDTMSGMVDKINYNFTLLSLKGGGPAGIQGIQGLRGPVGPQAQGIQGTEGNMIYNIDPTPNGFPVNNYNLRDTFIYNGVIYQITENGVQQITNLYDSVQSPFGLAVDGLQTINPHTNYKTYPFILGIDTGETTSISEILSHTSSDRGVLNISNKNLPSFIKFFNNTTNNTTLIGTIKGTNTDKFVLQGDTENGIQINGGGFHIDVDKNGISLPVNRTNTEYSTSSFIVSTKNDKGTIDNNWYNAWCTVYDNNCATLFPFKSGSGSTSSIGLKTNLQHRIDQICVTKTANLFFDTGNGITEYVSIQADGASPTSPIVDNTFLSKNGIALGGLKTPSIVDSIHAKFESDLFSIKLSTPTQWASNQKYGTMMTITSLGDNTIPGVVSSDYISISDLSQHVSTGNSDWLYCGRILLTTNINEIKFKTENYGNLIVADRKSESGSHKSANDTLHIHGADSMRYSGNDIVLSGGNQLGNSSNKSSMGGNVYLSGGSAFNGDNNLKTDIKRYGDVIIGINPLHHVGCFNPSNYTSTSYLTNNSSTNPENVGFFDVNNVAIHGNRIVIDSNANFRKITDGYTKDKEMTSSMHGGGSYQANQDWKPYVSSPENTTFQVSGVNTISHTEPIVIDRKEICSHQFMSGVMRRGIRFYLDSSNKPAKEFIDQSMISNTFVKNNGASLYFLYEQVWQKVGNIVNVNVFGRWLTTSNYIVDGAASNLTGLYHIADHFFTTDINSLGGVQYFNNNPLLLQWLLTNDKKAYLDVPGPDCPMTVFAIPVVVENMRSTFCYGNGNVYTEDNMNRLSFNTTLQPEPSGGVTQSSPVVIGQYHRPYSTERTTDLFRTFGTNHGNRSALYSNAHAANEHDNFNCAFHSEKSSTNYDFMSTSIKTNDGFRFSPNYSSPGGEKWIENNFTHTEFYDNDNYCYVYPEMIVDFWNREKYNESISRYSKRTRPCVGLYTWISLNYSYSVMDGFNGEILPLTNSAGIDGLTATPK